MKFLKRILKSTGSLLTAVYTAVVKAVKSLWTAAYDAVDVRDFFGFGGIYMIFHGLEMYKPWIAYTVSGAILMLFGFGWFNPPNKAKK